MWKKILISTSLILTLTTPAQAASLETLFAGFDNGCAMNSRFWAFHRSLVRINNRNDMRNPRRYYLPGNPQLPKGIQGSLGRVQLKVENSDEYTVAQVPLRGNFYNLPVVKYEGIFGNANGISSMILTINAPLSTVQKVLQKNKVSLRSRYEREIEQSYQAKLFAEQNRTQLVCDWSN